MAEEVKEAVLEENTEQPEKKKHRPKKEKSKARKIIEWVLTGIFGALFLFFAVANVQGLIDRKNNYGQILRFGYGSFVVQTDSMEPEIMTGTAIVTKKVNATVLFERYKKNETIDITFMDVHQSFFAPDDTTLTNQTNFGNATNLPMTHRVREIHMFEDKKYGEGRFIFVAAGINTEGHLSGSNQYQVFTEKEILGVVILNSRFLGGFYKFISSIWGLIILLFVPAAYLIITSVIDIFKGMDEKEAQIAAEAENNSKNIDLSTLSKEEKDKLKNELLQQYLDEKAAKKETKEKKDE